MTKERNQKTLLVLGGTYQQIKIIEAAKRMGVRTIVTDYLPNSPAKRFADKAYDISITDIEGLVKLCKTENVNGVITGYIDPCQRPYYQLCECMGFYCYGTPEQFFAMTDKHAFKELCINNNIDVIKEYKHDELSLVQFPVFVKPVDSRGSRGQSVCYNETELMNAIVRAKQESSNGDFVIEKYMKYAFEFQVTYFFIDGEPFLLRTCDSYCGSEEKHMENTVACAISPSRFTQEYIRTTHERVVKMFKSLGIKNGPVFMQGFYDKGVFRFFDPGRRFPGVDYERIYQKVFGVDIMEAMVSYALTGKCCELDLPDDGVFLKGKRAAILFPTIKAGIISEIKGIEEIKHLPEVISYIQRYEVGDEVKWTYNVNQRCAEIDILAENVDELKEIINYLQSEYRIINDLGQNMALELFDPKRIV